MPRLAWISMVATLAIGVLTLAFAIAGMSGEQAQVVEPNVTAPNPINASVRVLVWVYRVGVLFVLSGAVVYLVRIAQAMRRDDQGVDVA